MNWDDLRFFLAVAGAGSLSGAAQQLNVNTTTVLRRVSSLEEDLGARLFERERTGYRLTPEGEKLMEALDPVDRRLSSLQRDFTASASAGTQGTVRLASGEVIAASVIAPALRAFRDQHDGLDIELLTDPMLSGASAAPRIANPLKDVDVAIRAARPTQGDMLMRKVGDLAFGLYASAEYLAERGRPGKMGDLAGHDVIGFPRSETPLGPVWWLSRAEKPANTLFRSSSAAARAEAARAGCGLAALPCILGDRDPGLERVFGPEIVGALELWLLTRNDLAQLGHVRTVMDFLVGELKAKRGELEGRGQVTEIPLGSVQTRAAGHQAAS